MQELMIDVQSCNGQFEVYEIALHFSDDYILKKPFPGNIKRLVATLKNVR